MTTLEDRASDPRRDVVLAAEAAGVYRLQDDELTPADGIGGEDEFPRHGEFLDVLAVSAGHDGEFRDEEPAWLECPSGLAAELLERGVQPGDVFAVSTPQKDETGRWSFAVSAPETAEELL